jgi:hypothetical protein
MMKKYTVNTSGDNVGLAERLGYHAYYANGVTAIELQSSNKANARKLIASLGLKVLFIFE